MQILGINTFYCACHHIFHILEFYFCTKPEFIVTEVYFPFKFEKNFCMCYHKVSRSIQLKLMCIVKGNVIFYLIRHLIEYFFNI